MKVSSSDIIFMLCMFGALFTIGLYNFSQLTKEQRKDFVSFQCNKPENKFWWAMFPIVVINFGFICLISRRNIEKDA